MIIIKETIIVISCVAIIFLVTLIALLYILKKRSKAKDEGTKIESKAYGKQVSDKKNSSLKAGQASFIKQKIFIVISPAHKKKHRRL